jgi:hypothetical protein
MKTISKKIRKKFSYRPKLPIRPNERYSREDAMSETVNIRSVLWLDSVVHISIAAKKPYARTLIFMFAIIPSTVVADDLIYTDVGSHSPLFAYR